MTLLLTAVVFDVSKRQIPNRLILTGICFGVLYQIHVFGTAGLFFGAVRFGLSVPILFLFYQSAAFGAGDLKLISMMSLILNWEELGSWLFLSLISGIPTGLFYRLRGEHSFPFAIALFAGRIGVLLLK